MGGGGGGGGGGYGHIRKWIQENIIFMRFCCFKQSKKTEKLSNEQPTHAIPKCTLAGLLEVRLEIVPVYSAQQCFFLPLPHVLVGIQNAAAVSEKQKTKTKTACIREIQIHKLWTKVYSRKGLTDMGGGGGTN